MYVLLGTAAVSLVGAAWVSYVTRIRRQASVVRQAEERAKALQKRAQRKYSDLMVAAQSEANTLALSGRATLREEIHQLEEELHLGELRLEREEQRVHTLRRRQEKRSKELEQRSTAVKQRFAQIKGMRGERRGLLLSEISRLEERLDLSREEVVHGIANRFLLRAENESKQILRQTEEISESEYAPLAKRIMGITIGRIGQTTLKDRPHGSVTGTQRNFEALLKSVGGEPAALDALFGIPLIIQQEGETVNIRFDTLDTVTREVVRRVLDKTFCIGKIPEDLADTFQKRMEEMENELVGLGRRAFKMAGLKPKADKEIIKLLGRLYFRTSYTQNQWLHSVEAAQVAGLMAHELKLHVPLAKRATLLHDIGKALTHIREGSHAVIGAEIAKRCGEDPIVVNAIGSHHGDIPEESLYARIVMAADALSGARPGARRELVETYFDRIRALERVARDFKGVREVYAVQAGRELRVIVDNNKVSDQRTQEIADAIAEKISDEVVFPGRIKVTVIRRFATVEYAQ